MSNRTDRLAGCHAHLQGIYAHYPLTRLLVESAGKLERVPGHNFSSVHIAFRDWLWSIFGREDRAYRETLWVIDQLIPPDHKESSIYQFNPALPGLPPRPELTAMNEQQRHEAMRKTLETLFQQSENKE